MDEKQIVGPEKTKYAICEDRHNKIAQIMRQKMIKLVTKKVKYVIGNIPLLKYIPHTIE